MINDVEENKNFEEIKNLNFVHILHLQLKFE